MREILTSPRILDLKRKRRKGRIRLAILLGVLFLSILTALAYFSGHPRVVITDIEIIGTQIVNAPEVKTLAREKMKGRYFYLFSRANAFIYPHNAIYIALRAQFPRIESLEIDRINIHTIRISILEREGSYLYCGKEVPEAEIDVGENCYFINDDGFIFDEAPYFSGDIYFKFYTTIETDDTNESFSPLGLHVFSEEKFHQMIRFIDGLKSLGFDPISFIKGTDVNTISLSNENGITKPAILFRDDNNLEVILDNLSVSMRKREFADEIKSKYTTLLYIDLRFNNKVLYKFEE